MAGCAPLIPRSKSMRKSCRSFGILHRTNELLGKCFGMLGHNESMSQAHNILLKRVEEHTPGTEPRHSVHDSDWYDFTGVAIGAGFLPSFYRRRSSRNSISRQWKMMLSVLVTVKTGNFLTGGTWFQSDKATRETKGCTKGSCLQISVCFHCQ